MKKILFLALALGMTLSLSAQFKSSMLKQANHIAPALSVTNIDLPVIAGELPPSNNVSNPKSINDDPVSSITRYDLQTNASTCRRLFLYPDGTLGTTATWSQQDAAYSDRGTGYNYWDGTAFGPLPTARVETIRVGWPSYLPFGANGELIVTHEAAGNLVLNTRPAKGTGAWTQQILPNAVPTGVPVCGGPGR